jgi:hypothetical protein
MVAVVTTIIVIGANSALPSCVCARIPMMCSAGRSSSGSSKNLPLTPSKAKVKQGNLDGEEHGSQVQQSTIS